MIEYVCPKCSLRFEAFTSLAFAEEARTTTCKKCNSNVTWKDHVDKFQPCTNFSFKGGRPSEAATADQDKLIDALVGRAAEQGKAIKEKREKEKREFRRKNDAKYVARVGDEYIKVEDSATLNTAKGSMNGYDELSKMVKSNKIKTDKKGRVHVDVPNNH